MALNLIHKPPKRHEIHWKPAMYDDVLTKSWQQGIRPAEAGPLLHSLSRLGEVVCLDYFCYML